MARGMARGRGRLEVLAGSRWAGSSAGSPRWLLFRLPSGTGLAESQDGFVVVGSPCWPTALTELVHGYGFLGVFVAALTLRAAERRHEFHQQLHDFAEEIEQLALAVLLLLLGASFTSLFSALVTGPMLLAALLILFVVRPLAGLVSLVGSPARHRERAAIAFFGIRGMGSFYYLAYAVTAAGISEAGELWATVTLVVVLSILVHGISADPSSSSLERKAAAAGEDRPLASPGGGDHPVAS